MRSAPGIANAGSGPAVAVAEAEDVLGPAATGPTDSGKCALGSLLAEAGVDAPLPGDSGSGTSLTRGACETGAATSRGHVEESGAMGAEGATSTSEEHVPAQTRERKQDPMGSGMALNSERKSKSDDGRGLDFSAKRERGLIKHDMMGNNETIGVKV
ncbi:hypothetical protein GUJ93_ZPchr0006g41629 [Zizania palustris]|uniref:Uncharacterized protein n=1 Tax=Zizania palustris TaxID=103762 RepID=A0A8J5SEU1_ZIZPA|nr:hypothetical protein GUJ93_ZPchr0006g41629 [Zizania palustris]